MLRTRAKDRRVIVARLDRNRAFGVVYGSGAGHSFEQDGRLFDHDDNEVGQPKQKADDKPSQSMKSKFPPTPHDAELEAQLKG